MKEEKASKTFFSHRILAQMSKTIAENFVFIDFDLYYTEPDSSHGSSFEGGGLCVRKQLKRGGIFNGG